MNYKNLCYVVLFFVFVMAFFTGCAPSARIPVLKPAEINLRGLDKIAVGNISGNIGPLVGDLLTSRLFESDKFTVVDRQNLDRIMSEHRLNLSGTVDPDTASEMGKLTGAACLITGNSQMNYEFKRWTGKAWKDKQGKWHRLYNVKGTANVKSTLKVIDLTTGQIMAVKSISKSDSASDWQDNQWPQNPDKDSLVSSAVDSMMDTFMKMIAPYTVYVQVTFEKSDLPESEAGVTFAKQGLWKDALIQFKAAKDAVPSEPGLWYNLGLAYEYNFKYRHAIEAFKEAIKIEPSKKYFTEISNVKRLQAERKKLEQQGAINPEN